VVACGKLSHRCIVRNVLLCPFRMQVRCRYSEKNVYMLENAWFTRVARFSFHDPRKQGFILGKIFPAEAGLKL